MGLGGSAGSTSCTGASHVGARCPASAACTPWPVRGRLSGRWRAGTRVTPVICTSSSSDRVRSMVTRAGAAAGRLGPAPALPPCRCGAAAGAPALCSCCCPCGVLRAGRCDPVADLRTSRRACAVAWPCRVEDAGMHAACRRGGCAHTTAPHMTACIHSHHQLGCIGKVQEALRTERRDGEGVSSTLSMRAGVLPRPRAWMGCGAALSEPAALQVTC